MKLKIEVYLLKHGTNIEHFWLEDELIPIYYKRLFEGTLIDALIRPASCEDNTRCFSQDEKAVIYLKSNTISFFIAWKLDIKNIIFDASELIPDGQCYQDNKNSKTRCCSSVGDLPIQQDILCNGL
jgi:hypothetical protein